MTKLKYLDGFRVGKFMYEHKVDTSTKTTFLSNQDEKRRVCSVNEGGWVYDKGGKIAGRFMKNERSNWYYESLDKEVKMSTKFADLPEAERDVFKRLIGLGYLE